MRPASDKFMIALRGSHVAIAELELYFPDALQTPVLVEPIGGSVTIDRTAQVRRSGSVSIPWSMKGKDLLGGLDIRTMPLGGYVVPKRGILHDDGTRELITLGRLRCESVSWSETQGQATLELADRSAQLRDEQFQLPYAPVGVRVAQIAKTIVEQVFGAAITYTIRYDPNIIPYDVVLHEKGDSRQYGAGSRLDALHSLAKEANAQTYFDAEGNWIFDVAIGQQPVAVTGTLTNNSASVTGLSSTTGIAVGMTCTGKGIPEGAKVTVVNSATQVTLSVPARLTVLTAGQLNGTDPTHPEYARIITYIDTSQISFGMSVVGAGIPPGTFVIGVGPTTVYISQSATILGHSVLTFSTPATSVQLKFAGGASGYPVWTIDAGERGVLIDSGESLDRTASFNGVFMTYQLKAEDKPGGILVTDNSPTSPTRWGGPFGKVVRVEQVVLGSANAQAMAQTMLNESLGLTRSLTITAAPNPTLEAGDTVQIVFADGRQETHVIDACQISLGTEALRLATRSVAKPEQLVARWAQEEAGVYSGEEAWAELREAVVVG